MNIKKVAAVLAPVTAVILVIALLFIFMERRPTHPTDSEPVAPEYYAGGELFDVSGSQELLHEEEGGVFQVGWRLVKLAGGESFSAEQQRQMAGLVGGLCEEIRGLGMDVERLQAQVKQLWALEQERAN